MTTNDILEKLQRVIEYTFNNPEVLKTALIHKSYATDHNLQENNERMEFLGDGVLSAIVVNFLYKKYPGESEGKLSQIKSQIVSSENLSVWARKICLGDFILLGKSENYPQARQRESLLCDAFEALTGAIFLDANFERAQKFIYKFLEKQSEIIITDYKSRLQEILQAKYKILPVYEVVKESGPDHNKIFEIAVYMKKKLLGTGMGHSKKDAQQVAAREAIKHIEFSNKEKM